MPNEVDLLNSSTVISRQSCWKTVHLLSLRVSSLEESDFVKLAFMIISNMILSIDYLCKAHACSLTYLLKFKLPNNLLIQLTCSVKCTTNW